MLFIFIKCFECFCVLFFLNVHVLKRMVQTSNFQIINEYVCSSLPIPPSLLPPSPPHPPSLKSYCHSLQEYLGFPNPQDVHYYPAPLSTAGVTPPKSLGTRAVLPLSAAGLFLPLAKNCCHVHPSNHGLPAVGGGKRVPPQAGSHVLRVTRLSHRRRPLFLRGED